tara:strand:+ start:3921 stop:4520 length:600 start_codon:yes stop_codon:yes gene_type:complete
MTTFTFPAITPSTNTFELVANTRTFQSPLTNAIQTSSRKGSLWRASLQFNNLSGADRKVMQAFLVKLNGQEHRFTLHDHSHTRRGAGGGTLRVNGGTQSGTSLVCDGATASVANYLRSGDYISFNNELHMVVADADSDGSGNITLSIAPPIRKTPADDTIVDYTVPVSGVFLLAGPASWQTTPSITSSFTIEAVEDVLA